jgi:hypothetical protein
MMLWAHGCVRDALTRAGEGLVTAPHLLLGQLVRVFALTELGRLDEARDVCAQLLAHRPTLNADWLLDRYADTALELRSRVASICARVGIPAHASTAQGAPGLPS